MSDRLKATKAFEGALIHLGSAISRRKTQVDVAAERPVCAPRGSSGIMTLLPARI
jgi:hypothetical protein